MLKVDDLRSEIPPQRESPISLGVDIGGKAGCLLSVIYAMIGLVLEYSLFASQQYASLGEKISSFFLFAGSGAIVVVLFAIFPSILLGLITGFLIGWLAKIFGPRVSMQGFVLLSMLTCAIILILLHVAMFVYSDGSLPFGMHSGLGLYIIDKYYFVMGIPGLIYVAAGGWLGRKLYQTLLF